MERNEEITLSRSEGLDLLALLEDVKELARYIPEVALQVEIQNGIDLLSSRLYGWLPPGEED